MKKYYSFLGLVFVSLCLLILFACGGEEERHVVKTEAQIANSSEYYSKFDGTYIVLDDNNFQFTMDDFVVRIYYSDNQTEDINDFSFNVDDNSYESSDEFELYLIHFSRNNEEFTTLSIKVLKKAKILPSLKGINKDGEDYYLAQELHYTGENINALDYIETNENGVTLSSLLNEGKIEISGDTSSINASYHINSGYYYFVFTITGKNGYVFEDGSIDRVIKWQIKRQIIDTPKLTSPNEFVYDYTVESGNIQGKPQGLTFDFKGYKDLIISEDQSRVDAGEHEWRIDLIDPSNYAFLDKTQELDCLKIDWKINPKRLNVNGLAISDTDHLVGEDYHYTYTGNVITPQLNISEDTAIFYINYANSGLASSEAYNIVISVNTNQLFIPSGDINVLNNFVWNDGSRISVDYNPRLEFYIDKKQCVAKDEFSDSLISLKHQSYSLYGNTLSQFLLSNDEYTSFTQDAINSLNELNMFDNDAIFEWASDKSLLVGNNEVVMYWYETTVGDYRSNYIPVEIKTNITIDKAIADLSDASWTNDNKIHRLALSSEYGDYINGLIDKITYKTYYDVDDYDTTVEATNLTDAGYYTVVATLPVNDYYVYSTDGTNLTTNLTKKWKVDPINAYININTSPSVWTAYNGEVELSSLNSYYYEIENIPFSKTIVFDIKRMHTENIDSNVFDVTVTNYILDGKDWIPTINCGAVGRYKSVANLTFKEGIKPTNYIINYGAFDSSGICFEIEWYVYPNAYGFTTTDESREDYLGWKSGLPTAYLYDGNPHQPYMDCPFGLSIDYAWTFTDYFGNVRNEYNQYYIKDVGKYDLDAYLSINTNYPGYDKVVVSVDGKTYLENGQKVIYDIYGSEERRLNIKDSFGQFYKTADTFTYLIYQPFVGKTFTLKKVVAGTLDGSDVDPSHTTNAENIQDSNFGKTAICGDNNVVYGTCSFDGADSFDSLAESGNAYTYIDENGSLTITQGVFILRGEMINSSQLRLIMNIDANVIYVFTYEIQ